MFLNPFNQIRTEKLTASTTAKICASDYVLSDARDAGRIALEVNNVNGSETVYIGNKDVTATTGIPIKAGEKRVFPVQMGSASHIYIVGSGDVIIGEYF